MSETPTDCLRPTIKSYELPPTDLFEASFRPTPQRNLDLSLTSTDPYLSEMKIQTGSRLARPEFSSFYLNEEKQSSGSNLDSPSFNISFKRSADLEHWELHLLIDQERHKNGRLERENHSLKEEVVALNRQLKDPPTAQ